MGSERRASPRVNVLDSIGMILVDVPSLRTTGLLLDLSEDGLGVQFAAPLPELATIQVGFPLGQRRVTGTCDAVWSMSTSRAAGLRFRDLPPEDRAEIRSCLQGLWSKAQATLQTAAPDRWETPTGRQPTTPPAATPDAGLSRSTQPDWAVRLAGRRQQELLEQLALWRQSRMHESAARESSASESEPVQAPQHPSAPEVIQEAAPAMSVGEIASALGVQPASTKDESPSAEARPLTPAWHRRYLRGIVWAAVLMLSLAGAGILWRLNRPEDRPAQLPEAAGSQLATSQARAAESLRSPDVGIIEIIEGKPVAHSDEPGKRQPKALTGGAAVLRDLPTYDDAALASRLQGDVYAVLTITDRGVVQEVRVTRGNSVLAKQVVNAAAHWRFRPYFDDFGPVSVELPVIFRFHLMAAKGAHPRTSSSK